MTPRPPDLERTWPGYRYDAPGIALTMPEHARRMWRWPMLDAPAAPMLGAWLIECDRLHGVWSFWLLSVVHLRTLPECPPAVGDGNAHELLIWAVDPETPPTVDRMLCNGFKLLQPPMMFRFDRFGADDAHALKRLELLVAACVNGKLTPDDDDRARWRALLQLERAPEL
jgi:hypothetical protein